MPRTIDLRIATVTLLIALAAASRLIPHPYNFAPMGAMALFGAAHFRKKWMAFAIPFGAHWLSDLWFMRVVYPQHYAENALFAPESGWIYGTYALIALLGLLTLRKVTVPRVIGSALGASAIFFIITNFACWPGNPAYAQDLGGLMACYAAGLPFLQGTVLGDLFYSGVLFGAFALAERSIPALRPAEA
ncbi:MAG: DUF6580 family putative transport protein [Flavobacteriales bacterium]